mgnify:CR=1 FL=1
MSGKFTTNYWISIAGAAGFAAGGKAGAAGFAAGGKKGGFAAGAAGGAAAGAKAGKAGAAGAAGKVFFSMPLFAIIFLKLFLKNRCCLQKGFQKRQIW